MINRLIKTLAVCSALFLISCSQVATNGLTQISTVDALLAGLYDGQMSLEQLLEYGDFGLGTVNGLDGEMVILNGRIYQIPSSGNAVQPEPSTTTTPFATVTFFDADRRTNLSDGLNYEAVKNKIHSLIASDNLFYAVKITGRFASLKTRSVPRQHKPYKPLSEVIKNEVTFELNDAQGTIVGFLSPSYIKGLNVPGFHFHFISADRKSGGHVLQFVVANALLELDEISKFSLLLPDNKAFYKLDLSGDKPAELNRVEQ